jgi:hypothetical protein
VKVFDSCAVRDQEEIWQAANMINSYTHKKGFADDISTRECNFHPQLFHPIHKVTFGFTEDFAAYLGSHSATGLNRFQRFQ